MTTTQQHADTTTSVVQFPEPCVFGTGPEFEVVLRKDVQSFHGNTVATAGRYIAQQTDDAPEGTITIWSPNHMTGGMWVSLSSFDWTFPGEVMARPIPEHDCMDNLRSGVAGGVFCGMCKVEVG